MDVEKKPERWWTQSWFVYVTLIPLWPVSLWFLWKSRRFGPMAKVMWTVLSGVLVVWISGLLVQVSKNLYELLKQY